MESLKLKTKLLYLLLSVALGLLIVGFVGYFNLLSMKKNVDTLYFGSLLPINELSSITTAYHHDLEANVYRWNNSLISHEELSQSITLGLAHVDQLWASYTSHHKRPEELPYVDYTASQIEMMKRYFIAIRSLSDQQTRRNAFSLNTLNDNINSIHGIITQLISYELAAAKQERAVLLIHYENSLIQLLVMLGAILIGVIGFAWRIFKQIELQQQQLLASAQALKHLNLKLEHASYTDTLTGLFNRRYFNLVYERETKRALRASKSISFMMIDIDFFKQYNDTYGHLQGDIALQSVARVLKTSLQRPGDFAFRLGGEEFGILLSDTDCATARKMAEVLRYNVESLGMEHKGNKKMGIVTISIGGVCITPTEGMGDEALLHSADTNLYAAKERGRNQVVFSTTL